MIRIKSKLTNFTLYYFVFQSIFCPPTLAQAQQENSKKLPSHQEVFDLLSEEFSSSQYRNLYFQENRGATNTSTPQFALPASSAVTVMFCSNVKFDDEQDSPFPVTVFLARPILDTNGNVVAPVNSLVSATVTPTEKGVKIKADAVVIGGQYIPIETPTLSVPVLSEVQQDNNYYSSYSYQQQTPSVYFNVANNLQNWLSTQGVFGTGTSDMLGAGLAIASGVSYGLSAREREPRQTEISEVAQGGMLIFPLLSAVELPETAIRSNARYVSQTAYSTTLPCSVDSTNSPNPGYSPNPGSSPENPIYETNNPNSSYTTTDTTRDQDYYD